MLKLGVYDYNKTFSNATDITFDLYYIWWYGYQPGSLINLANLSLSRNRIPVFSIQPNHSSKITKKISNYLSDITAGKYDSIISSIGKELSQYSGQIFIRWGHEMELQSNASRYDWVVNPSKSYQYVSAYNHTVSIWKNQIPNTKFIWSPSGNNGCTAYYPSSSLVDYVGLSLYEFPAFDILYWPGYAQSFSELFKTKYNVLWQLNKPLIVCELGMTEIGGIKTQQDWMTDTLVNAENWNIMTGPYPILYAVIYFNAADSVSWWYGGPIPDWSISPSLFNTSML